MNKLFKILLVFLFLILLIPPNETKGAVHGDYEYTVIADGIRLDKYLGTETDIVMPDYIDGKPVVEIGYEFHYRQKLKLTSVKFPNELLRIGHFAFDGNNLTSVETPPKLKYMGEYAFAGNQIKEVFLNDGLEVIDNCAFEDNDIDYLIIPRTVQLIKSVVFADNNLIKVTVLSKDVNLSDGMDTFHNYHQEVIGTIAGYKGSTIEAAYNRNSYGYKFIYIDEDLTSPTISLSKDGGSTELSHSVTITAIDEEGGTGLARLEYQWTDTNVTPTSGYSVIESGDTVNTPTEHKTYYLHMKATDFAGNISYKTSKPFIVGEYVGETSFAISDVKPFGTIKLSDKPTTYTTTFEEPFVITNTVTPANGWRLDVSATQLTIKKPPSGFKAGTSAYKLPKGTLKLKPLITVKRMDDSTGDTPTVTLKSETAIDNGTVTVLTANEVNGFGEFGVTFGSGALNLVIDPTTTLIDEINYPDRSTPYEATIIWDLIKAP